MVPYLKANHPEHWCDYRVVLTGEYGQMESSVRKFENGQLLTLEQILDAAGVKRIAPVSNGAAVPHYDHTVEGGGVNA
jgi:hypothetical protein